MAHGFQRGAFQHPGFQQQGIIWGGRVKRKPQIEAIIRLMAPAVIKYLR